VVTLTKRPLPDDTQHSQETNIHAPGGVRTHNPSKRMAEDLRLRPRGHWDRPLNTVKGKGKAVPLQASSGPEGSRKLRFPDYMTKAPTHRPPLPPGNAPGTHFCQRLSRPQGHSAIGRIMSMKKSSDIIWNRTSDLPICSTAP